MKTLLFLTPAIACALGLWGRSLIDPNVEFELPQAPEFEDVSSFGKDDRQKLDSWLLRQVDLAKYPSLAVAIVNDGHPQSRKRSDRRSDHH